MRLSKFIAMDQTEESLERLLTSGRCTCDNARDYANQLKELAQKEANKDRAKKRGKLFKALGDETRQRMLALLLSRELCVCEMITALGMSQPTTSHHLKILEDSGLVESRREGKWIFYGVKDRERVASLVKLSDD